MMEFLNEVWIFFQAHYQDILSALGLFLTVLVLILKRRPVFNKIDTIKEDILTVLPSLINKVETSGHGSEKLEAVVELVKTYILRKYNFKDFEELNDFVVNSIESILTTPKKKG